MAGSSMTGWRRALFVYRPQLEQRLIIEHHITTLHEAVPGGFLTNMEEKDIMSQSNDYIKVRKLVDVLTTKDEMAFEAFVAFLKKKGHAQIAEELERTAKEGIQPYWVSLYPLHSYVRLCVYQH